MKKPNNYEETQVQGEFTPVELGGHKLVIKQVEERMSRTNKPMIVVFFDFAPGDKQAGYFAEAFKNDIRPEKKWPNQATQYILTEDNEGKHWCLISCRFLQSRNMRCRSLEPTSMIRNPLKREKKCR